MAEKQTESDDTDNEEGGEGDGTKKGKSKLLIILPIVLVLAIVGGLFASGVIGGGSDKKEEETASAEGAGHGDKSGKPSKPVYYELPEFLVNLSGTGTRVSFLKMSVTLELRDQAAVPLVEANKPRIIDTFNTYLREMRPTDLSGSAGIYRLRDELMTRMNKTIEEGLVKDILFSEIIVQ